MGRGNAGHRASRQCGAGRADRTLGRRRRGRGLCRLRRGARRFAARRKQRGANTARKVVRMSLRTMRRRKNMLPACAAPSMRCASRSPCRCVCVAASVLENSIGVAGSGGFAEFVEQLLTQPALAYREALTVEPLRASCHAVVGAGTLLLPVRLRNAGTHVAVPDGPGRTMICCEVRGNESEQVVMPRTETRLPALLMPGQVQVAALPISLPMDAGSYRLVLWLERIGTEPPSRVELPLTIGAGQMSEPRSCTSAFLDTVQETLPKTHALQQLPADYVDVTEGAFAPAKRWIKRKLLNNFKHAYVDAMSRQQSQVNGQVVLMIQQLAECSRCSITPSRGCISDLTAWKRRWSKRWTRSRLKPWDEVLRFPGIGTTLTPGRPQHGDFKDEMSRHRLGWIHRLAPVRTAHARRATVVGVDAFIPYYPAPSRKSISRRCATKKRTSFTRSICAAIRWSRAGWR